MARTPSNMIDLGTPVPDFQLSDSVSGQEIRPLHVTGQPLLIFFICNHCPFVIHVRETLVSLCKEYMAKGVAVCAINSNSIESHPQDGPEHMKALALSEGWRFPYAFDADQSVARAFQAACTPDFFVFDQDHRLAYRGQMDDSRPGSEIPVTGDDLRAALDAVLAGDAPSGDQKPSLGCNIKWKPGNAPASDG